ncbi:LysR family transcriptional regulator [Pacificibacter marinus]|jgi:DNA-binding transcriptional LysR family regulator|uniref:HTH-type transcriptional regulator CynR n=1 Tax=Pacificibacter marinus TaxID=658057 RepID=A0A1Y5T6B5_9RHOB|nr:LysR family transcriptional regulator [Pacificibacter marinus]SEL21726.1 DNA-binding transcriptional regulator, LysR family [Pacificibacter marinus]SLN56344.1 HTH-type transcriptional regulator CynR [Pacificibacter marinus]
MELHRLGLVSSGVHHFMLVARLKSIRQAALYLNVAPSSISRSIKQLEENIGMPLFERTKQRLRLTSAGELMLYHVQQSSVEMNRAMTEIGDLQGLRRGTVTLAVIESAARGLVSDVLAGFWVRHPDICVDVRVTGSQDAVDMVAQGDADIAIAFDTSTPHSTRRFAVTSLPLGVLVPPGSRLTKHEGPLRVYDLAGERVILPDGSLTLGSSVEQILPGSFVEFSRRTQTNSIGLMIDLAIKGLGIIMQTKMGVQAEISRGQLVFIPLKDPRLQKRRLSLISRPKNEASEATEALSTSLAKAIERLGA